MLSCRVGGDWKFENLWSNCALWHEVQDQELGLCYFYTCLKFNMCNANIAENNVVENLGLVGPNANTLGDQVGETVISEAQAPDQDALPGDGKQVVSSDEECEEVWHDEEPAAAQSIKGSWLLATL
ncbi:hypothetical protein CIPAW_03G112100 [Carya illinoinensis]|uniref:Uncharacterized protein n=1 Tax=Carya illinoinensis TaxID=32201 RepID=A0A8T1QZG7_CARIL|nr:hypothetical protein CIPAW_03G112100 [Carya illinoinensis]